MSLRVWLPLTKDLRNQGLDDITITNNGATFNSAGKLGGCYQFGPNKNIKLMEYASTLSSFNEFSLSVWFKCTAQNTGHSGSALISCGDWNQSTHLLNLALCYYNTDHYTTLLITSNSGWSYGYSYNFQLNTWYHVVLTTRQEEVKAYVNGELIGNSANAIVPTDMAQNWICIGNGTYYSGFTFNGFMNDVRIYDHALSPLEVKEISKGLILHYPLSDNSIQSLNNCYAYPRFETSSSNGGWSHWGSSGHVGTYGQTTDTNYIFRNGQTYAHWVANGSSATKDYLLYQEPAFDGGLRSLVAICKEENSKPITNNICYAAWNARNGGAVNNSWTSIHSLGNGFYLCKCEGISQDGSNDLVGIYIKPGYKVYFSEVYLENYKSVCSNIFFPSTVIYDTSGYGNNGTLIGSFNVDKNTPRYTVSTKFNGAEVIVVPFTCGSISEAVTVACWGYESNWNVSTAERLLGAATNSSGWCIGDYGSENTLFAFYANGGYNAATGFKQLSTGWHHFVITFDGLNLIYYVDGQQFSKKTFSTKQVATGNYNINIGRHYGGGYNFKGNMSDVRVYATALSAEDVKSLYQNSAYIDNQGNIYGAVYEEV